jgi:hypothetical protein
MKTLRPLIILSLGLLCCAAVSPAQQHDDADSKQFVKIENEFRNADESGDPAALEKYLAADYVVKGDGKMWDKTATI